MVCKEDILTWFKDLDSYKRIDLLCELINMCLPFELRFLGSYIEETGKHSYQELRQQALAANDLDKLDKDSTLKNQSLYEDIVRHRMLINVSLLKSRNYNVANWYSKNILRTDYIEESIAKDKDDVVQHELLLLYTMAARHPAFSFENKLSYNRLVDHLYELREMRFNKSAPNYRYPPGFECQNIYKNMNKVQENNQFPTAMRFAAVHPPGLPPHMDYFGHFQNAWPTITCGAPAEVPPFPQLPLQPPQPSTSPLVNSPSQSRCGSPRPVSSGPATFTILPSSTPSSLGPISATNPSGLVPGSILTSSGAPVMGPVASMLPGMVPLEILPPMAQTSQQQQQTSPVFNQIKQENEDINTTLKDDSQQNKSHPGPLNAWMEPKHINGLRIAQNFPPPPPPINLRSSIADQLQTMALTDESSHYHSSSSSSPLQTPPETPSNLVSGINSSSTPHNNRGGGGGGAPSVDKTARATNGIPAGGFIPSFGENTSSPPPPPSQSAFTFPAYTPIHPRFYTTSGFRPPTTVYGQFPPNQAFQGPQSVDSIASSYPTYSLSYFPLMYSSYAPPPPPPPSAAPPTSTLTNNPVPQRIHPPGCYNCGAAGHLGQDCPQQNIEEITQKNTYSIDFSPVNSDNEK